MYKNRFTLNQKLFAVAFTRLYIQLGCDSSNGNITEALFVARAVTASQLQAGWIVQTWTPTKVYLVGNLARGFSG